MSFNLESGKSKEINETPEVKVDSEQLSETEETAENFDDCSLNEVQDSKGNEVNAESLEDVEEDYDDCEAKMEEMEEKNPELDQDDDDFNDCGKETDGQYVAEVTYATDGEISQEEASAELQEAYNECDDPEDMQQLKENVNENEHIEVHNAEVVERPEVSEMGEEVTEEEYEEAQQELDEAQENLEAQQEAAQEYQEDLENQINKYENEVSEGIKNINNINTEITEETENSDEVKEAAEEGEYYDEAEEIDEETENSDEVDEATGETEGSDETEEANEETENSDEVEEATEDAENSEGEEIRAEDLENVEDDSQIETSEIDEENLSENVSQEVEKKTDTELSDETKEQIAEEVSDEINSEAENNEISAAKTEEIIDEKKAEAVEYVDEQSAAMDDEIEQNAEEIAEQDKLTEEEAKEQISEEVSENTSENLSDDEMDSMVEKKSEAIEETIEEKAEEQEAVDSVKETADELEDEKTEQLSEQSEQSLQERIDGAFDKEDITASEINSLRDEHSAELQSKIEEKSITEAELKTKFDEVLSKEKGSDEYRQLLQEYNALQDRKAELDEQIATMEKQQDLLDKKSIELREAQIQKGSEAMATSVATLAGVNILQERYDQTYYDTKADKTELTNIRDESCSAIKELSAEKDSIKQAMDAKMDEISEYVTSNNMDRYDTAHDLRYQQMSAEYNAMKESYDRIGYSIVKLDENNKAITAWLEGKESLHSKFGRYDVDDHGFIKGENFGQYIQDWEGYSSEHYKTEYYENAETQIISPSLVEGIRISEYDISAPNVFWSQHEQGGTEQSFDAIAKHIPEVQSRLESGESLLDIMQDKQIGICAAIYFHPNSMPKVIKCGDYYEFQDNGRHRILAARNVGYDIPVKIIGERKITSSREVNDCTPNGIEDSTAYETDALPNSTATEVIEKSSISAFFGRLFAHNEPGGAFASVENVSNQPIDTLHSDLNEIEDDSGLDERFAKIKDKSFSELTEQERTELINIAVENLKQKYKETIPESRFEEIKQKIKFIDKATVIKELFVSEDEADYYLGWYSSSTDDIKINVSAENNIGSLLATLDHEAMHMATQRKDGTYITGVKTNTIGIHYRNVGMNEGLTEMYSIRNIQELYPDYVSNSYTENVKLMKRFESVFGKKELRDAYLTNNFESIRNDYENYMGKGSFVDFCNLMDSMHNDYSAHMISSGRQKSIQLQQLITNYESKKNGGIDNE